MRTRAVATMTREGYDQMPMVIDVTDVAAMGGLSTRTVLEYARTGKLPAAKIGGKWKFNKETVAGCFGIV